MRILVLSVGTQMPAWVQQAWEEYSKRMPPHCRLELKEIPAGKRGKNADIRRILEDEAARLQAAIPRDAWVAALDRVGKSLDSKMLAGRVQSCMDEGRDLVLLIGGPEGLTEECLGQSDARWSLSALTLAHPVVRVVVAEQVYRAWSILAGLPYHR